MLKALLLDLDNTAYAYAPCHAAGFDAAHALAAASSAAWQDRGAFRADYAAARTLVKERLEGTAASHCRLLYFKTMLERASGRSLLADARRWHEAYWAAYQAAMVLEPGCREAIEAFQARGVTVAWVTNFTTERQVRKLEALGLLDAADRLFTSEELGRDKPHPEAYETVLSALGVRPDEAWMVGDNHEDDVAGALAVGIRGLWFCREAATGQAEAIDSWAALQAMVDHAAAR